LNTSPNLKSQKIIILFIFINYLFAQSDFGRISGYLKDVSTGEPIMYANVVLEETDIGTASDSLNLVIIGIGDIKHSPN
jgi:hypothetical protein